MKKISIIILATFLLIGYLSCFGYTATITDLGSMQLSATLQWNGYARIPSGKMYSVWWWWLPDGSPTNIFSLNHDTGVVTPTVHAMLGRPYAAIQHPVDHLLYLGIYKDADSSSDIGTFNFVTGAYTFLHKGPYYPVASTDGGPHYDGIGNQGSTYSDEPHKRVFFYGATRAGLWAWDPIDQSFQDYGILDDPGGAWRKRYGNSIQVDATKAYCEMRDSGPTSAGSVYLVICKLSDGTVTTKWKGTMDLTSSVEIHRGWLGGDAGKIFIRKRVGDPGVVTWYNVTDLDTPIRQPSAYPALGYRDWIDYTGYNYDASLALPDGVGGKTITLRYKKPRDTKFRTIKTNLLDVAPYASQGGGPDLDNNLILLPVNDGPIAKLITATDTKATEVFIGGLSGYSVGRDFSRGLLFFGGYSQQSFQYNPSLPVAAGTNPLSITLARQEKPGVLNPASGARYHYSCERASDGTIWWATSFVRSAYKSQIIWYNPDTKATGDVGWDALNKYNLNNCAMNHAGTKFLFSGNNGNSPYDGKIAVILTRQKVISKYLTPSGGWTQGKIVSVEADKSTTNRFVGIVPVRYVNVTVTGGPKPAAGETMTGAKSGNTTTLWIAPATWAGTIRCYFTMAGGNFRAENVSFSGGGTGTIGSYLEQSSKLYCVDIGTGARLWGPIDYNSAIFRNGQGPVFAHGYVWFYSGSNICKMDPATGTVTVAQAVAYPGQMCWIGDVLYHWDTTSAHLYKITGLI